jgi:hypothetical protein
VYAYMVELYHRRLKWTLGVEVSVVKVCTFDESSPAVAPKGMYFEFDEDENKEKLEKKLSKLLSVTI